MHYQPPPRGRDADAPGDSRLYVTKPFLPPLEDVLPYLEQLWNSRWLTNNGPLHQRFEEELRDFLGVPALSLFTNGTIALVTALQALRITGEVITTPFTFVATAHSLLWNGIKPVFCDIDAETLNLDTEKLEAAITPNTTAILAVHVYGRPCNLERLQQVADVYGLRLIYDAAHAFGVCFRGESVLRAGDLSILSFHATKVFNTFEGGAIVCRDMKTKQRIDYLKNFGFVDEVTVVAPGINGKMNEFQAMVGILQLRYIDFCITRRKMVDSLYREALADVAHILIPAIPAHTEWNYSYFPIFVEHGFRCTRDELFSELRKSGIFARRYFYPLVSNFPMYRGLPSAAPSNLPVATRIADQVLCLPIYPDLPAFEQERIIRIIRKGM